MRLLLCSIWAVTYLPTNSLPSNISLRKITMNLNEQAHAIQGIVNKSKSKSKAKLNKYASFSKANALDPIDQAIIAHEEKKLEIASIHAAPTRGTTVPFVKGSPKMNIGMNYSGNITDIIPSDPFTFGYVHIGTITSPHGVKGEVKATFSTDFSDLRTKSGTVMYIKKPSRLTPRPIVLEAGRKQVGNDYLLIFEGVRSRLSAAALKGYSLFAKKEDRPMLQDDEYLIRDIVGLECYKQTIIGNVKEIVGPIGVVHGVIPPDELCSPETAKLMHSMLEIRVYSNLRRGDCSGDTQLCLLPLVPQIVLEVNIASGRIVISPPDGLLDLTYIEKKKYVIRGFLPEKSLHLTDRQRKELQKDSISIIL